MKKTTKKKKANKKATTKKIAKKTEKKTVAKKVKKKVSKKVSKKAMKSKKISKKKTKKKASKKKITQARKPKIIIPPPEKQPIQDPNIEGINIPRDKLEELADHFKGIEITEEPPIEIEKEI